MEKSASLVEPDRNLFAWDAAMRTSAAPTFFPVYKGYVDGGIVANNPSMIAIAKAIAHNSAVSAKNVVVLSIGAGSYPRHADVMAGIDMGEGRQDRADWGIMQYSPHLLDLLLDGDTVTIDLVMHYLLDKGGMYHRLDPTLPRNIALDDTTSMKVYKTRRYYQD
jgi:predicted acylesterase/phospholipase RssA